MNPAKTTVLAVIIFLGIVAISTVIGGIYLAANDKSIPEAVVALGSASVGSLGTLLANPSTRETLK